MERYTVMGHIHGKMDEYMKEVTRMIKEMGMVHIDGQMEMFTSVNT